MPKEVAPPDSKGGTVTAAILCWDIGQLANIESKTRPFFAQLTQDIPYMKWYQVVRHAPMRQGVECLWYSKRRCKRLDQNRC